VPLPWTRAHPLRRGRIAQEDGHEAGGQGGSHSVDGGDQDGVGGDLRQTIEGPQRAVEEGDQVRQTRKVLHRPHPQNAPKCLPAVHRQGWANKGKEPMAAGAGICRDDLEMKRRVHLVQGANHGRQGSQAKGKREHKDPVLTLVQGKAPEQ
jgi:hypothetical protein